MSLTKHQRNIRDKTIRALIEKQWPRVEGKVTREAFILSVANFNGVSSATVYNILKKEEGK